ncbi:MAG: excinuclease ABC subunit UvrC [Pseudomonadota bacterium]|nr:excinuclease ABC subunit UvrC [Pseudomonadota bacterium]
MRKELNYNYNQGLLKIKEAGKTFPKGSGIYQFLNLKNEILYVGKARDLKKRILSYSNNRYQTNRIKLLISLTNDIKFIKTPTDVDSFILENNLIKQYKPKFNIRLIDDKSYPYISISVSNDWPRITKYRGKLNKENISFGPFSSVNSVDNVIKQLERAFLLRSCSDNTFSSRKRPCILYQIKRCSAPCVGLISKRNYGDLVNNAISFLEGKNPKAKERLINQMKSESIKQNYEKAARLRDRIKALTKISNEKYSDLNNEENFDIIFFKNKHNVILIHIFFFRAGKNLGNKEFSYEDNLFDEDNKILSQFLYFFYTSNTPPKEIILNKKPIDIEILRTSISQGIKYNLSIRVPIRGKKKLLLRMVEENVDAALEKKNYDRKHVSSILKNLQKKLKLQNFPKKIEIYDNSHLSGTNPVGAMVVFENYSFSKMLYRKFNINSPNKRINDDYLMIEQVVRRRFNISTKWKENFPQLIIIDGGKGHLNKVTKVFREKKITNVDFISIAKGRKRNSGDETIYTPDKIIKFKKNEKELFFLQRLRDEAHRFAVKSTKKRHQKSFRNSIFDQIEGIGKKTRLILLSYFGSIDNIKTAGIDDLKKIPRIGIKTAEKIYKEFNKNV